MYRIYICAVCETGARIIFNSLEDLLYSFFLLLLFLALLFCIWIEVVSFISDDRMAETLNKRSKGNHYEKGKEYVGAA